jgi:hypothetical protein
MNKTSWKYLGFGVIGIIPLHLLLYLSFSIFKGLEIIQDFNTNPILIIAIYGIILILYAVIVYFYFKFLSNQNLNKLKKSVENVTGKKVQ